jgi:hypothetical protein
LGENDYGGLAFVESGSIDGQKIAFRIKNCVSGSIMLGIGVP